MFDKKTLAACLVLSLLAVARAGSETDEEAKTKIDAFNQAYANRDESARVSAVESLAPVLHPTVTRVLVGLLAKDVEGVRIAAANGLGRVADDVAIQGLSGSLAANKKMPEVQKAILSALGATDSEKALPALHKMFDEFKDEVAVAAINAAGKIASPSSADALLDALHKGEMERTKTDMGGGGGGGGGQVERDRDIEAVFDPAKNALGNCTGGSEVTYKGWKDWLKKNLARLKTAQVFWCPGTQKTFEVEPGKPKLCPHDGEANKACGVYLKKRVLPQ